MANRVLHKAFGISFFVVRLLVASVFIFSGFVKTVDPMGTLYKVQDYVQALFGTSDFPGYVLMIFALTLSCLEFCVGVFLFLGIRRSFALRFALLFMVVMTPLTLWLALTNSVPDCGCFGDAVVLSNTWTFIKNVVLLMGVLLLNVKYKLVFPFVLSRNQWLLSLYTVLFALAFALRNLVMLPLFDFRPYAIGKNIIQEMEVPPGAAQPEFVTTFILEKNGEQREFTLDNYPDSTWTFVDSKTVQTKAGYQPVITDFAVSNPFSGQDVTDSLLQLSGYTFWLVVPYLEVADDGNIDKINEVNEYCRENGYGFVCLTSSSDKNIERWRDATGADYPFLRADGTLLKTIVRSTPGLVLLHDAEVVNKWSNWRLPQEADLKGPLEVISLGNKPKITFWQKMLQVLLWFCVPLLVVIVMDRMWLGTVLYRKLRLKNRVLNLLKQKKMRKKIVAGNWKMNMNLQEGVALATELKAALAADEPNCDVVVCTPFIHLASVANVLEGSVIGLGAENCADKVKGAYTGEVSAEMVKSTGAQYVILGHSERRAYYGETAEILKEKVNLALANGLKVIFCIGEVLEEREANKQNEVVKAQLEGSLYDLTAEQFANIILAYEPVWAIGTGKTATSDQAEEMHAFIRQTIAEKFGAEAAENVSILYGGSCKPSNAKEIFAKPDVDGGLIGGAALKCADFKGIIDAWKA